MRLHEFFSDPVLESPTPTLSELLAEAGGGTGGDPGAELAAGVEGLVEEFGTRFLAELHLPSSKQEEVDALLREFALRVRDAS